MSVTVIERDQVFRRKLIFGTLRLPERLADSSWNDRAARLQFVVERRVGMPVPPPCLALADSPFETGMAAPWIGSLVDLGAKASEYSERLAGRQLVIALSVPRRDFAAVLVGCGWVMAAKVPELAEPIETLRRLRPGDLVRLVNERHVLTESFAFLDESVSPPRALIGGSFWQVPKIKALKALKDRDVAHRIEHHSPGALGLFVEAEATWYDRLCSSVADLAFIGTTSWLQEDLKAFISLDGDRPARRGKAPAAWRDGGPASLAEVLLPTAADSNPASRFTWMYSSAGLASRLPLPADIRAVVLDGSAAVRSLGEIESQVVICVIDRSVADESAAELIVQTRNSRGEVLSPRDGLKWTSPPGVEALAFTVQL